MDENIRQTGARHMKEIQGINKNLTEKALKMRCNAYLAEVKADLLTKTIYLMKGSKAALRKEVDRRTMLAIQLQEERNFVSGILDTVGALVAVLDPAGRILRMNRAFSDTTGYTPEDLDRHKFQELSWSDDDKDEAQDALRQVIHEGKNVSFWHYIRTSAHERRYIEWSLAALFRSETAPLHIIVTGIDRTQRKQAEDRLKMTATVFDNAIEGIMITDANGVIQTVNPAFTAVTGYDQADVIGRTPRVLRSGAHGPEFYQAMWEEMKNTGQWQGEIWNRRKNGEVYPEWLSLAAIKDDSGLVTNYIGVFNDIAERKQKEETIRFLAYHDALTGLPNRQMFFERLSLELAHAKRDGEMLAVFFLDLDKLKHVNDSHGHDVGDKLIQEAAIRLKHSLRESDTVSRIAGDEFMALIPRMKKGEEPEFIAEKILAALKSPVEIGGIPLSLSASIGISIYPSHGGDPEELVKFADDAMYAAKRAGGGRLVLYSHQMADNG
ncbi:MAG: diguanylate cyclase [Nitrospinae bacterium]|nr:diguanylate cyclase [Nitrospinota bacterium]